MLSIVEKCTNAFLENQGVNLPSCLMAAKNDILSFLRTAIKTRPARLIFARSKRNRFALIDGGRHGDGHLIYQMCILRIWSYGLVNDILSLTTFDG